jgi:hypothetical protein
MCFNINKILELQKKNIIRRNINNLTNYQLIMDNIDK